MARKLQCGDRVLCRYFNTPDNRFYGETFSGEIVSYIVHYGVFPRRDFVVMRDDDKRTVSVWRKEIKRRLS